MKYDFDHVPSRRGTHCYKWDVGPQELPMWIADMDFPAAPEIRRALAQRMEHGVFGYTQLWEDWYLAYMDWWRDRHGLEIDRDDLIFATGVIPILSSAVRRFAHPNDNVVIQTPVYNVFFNSIVNNGCRVLENPLLEENGVYRIDWEDLERKLADPMTSLMLLCNPHNPVGKLWDRETLARIGALCSRHHVTVISDEIHCDLTAPGVGYVPFASVNETCRQISITCIAPTKTFNLAGLQTAAAVVHDPVLRHGLWRQLNTDEVAEPNVFAPTAAIAAFREGGDWLDQLRDYLWENRLLAEQYIARQIPGLKLIHGQATYLLWVDIRRVCPDSEIFAPWLREKTGLFVSTGAVYGQAGKGFLRINIACPRALVEDGLDRLRRGVEAWNREKA